MIIRDFYVVCIAIQPYEADPPLIIDTYAVLARTITPQRLQAVPRRHPQIIQSCRGIQHLKLSSGDPLNRPEAADRAIVEKVFGVAATKASDHTDFRIP
jgi:hypothetical protein